VPTPKHMTPADWLDLIARKAEGLRKAGVLEVSLEGCAVTLAPLLPEGPKMVLTECEAEPDLWRDPDTFGRRDGVPGFSRLHGNHDD
jgi:hypothetical protein